MCFHVSSSPHMLRTHAVMVSRERRGPNAASDADCRSKISWWAQDRPEQNPVLTEVTFPYHVWYIYPHLSKNTPNVGKLIPSMDPKGFWFSVLFFFHVAKKDCPRLQMFHWFSMFVYPYCTYLVQLIALSIWNYLFDPTSTQPRVSLVSHCHFEANQRRQLTYWYSREVLVPSLGLVYSKAEQFSISELLWLGL